MHSMQDKECQCTHSPSFSLQNQWIIWLHKTLMGDCFLVFDVHFA